MRAPRLAPLAALLLWPTVAQGQAYQCRAPTSVPPLRAESPDGPVRRVAITGHTLALSWSPEFCRTRAGEPRHRRQCSGAGGRFGFVIHGLWPEGGASWPQWCRKVAPPSPALLRAQACRTPSYALIGHAWAKHGSCMARDAATYFRIADILADSVRYPAMERLSRDPALTAGALREAFAAANPGRTARSFGLLTSRTGWLRQVMVCLDRRFRPARCPSRQFGPRDSAPVKIWRGL